RPRSIFSPRQPRPGTSTPVENGHRHLPRGCARHHNAGSHPFTTHPLLEFRTVQSRLQCLCGGALDMGGHAANHSGSARMVAGWRVQNPDEQRNSRSFQPQLNKHQERRHTMNARTVPDIILHNGRITTLDPKNPEATNLAIKDGRIVAVDSAEEYQRGPATKVIDLQGRRVVPGLNDSHLHVIRGGLHYNMELRWDGVPSLADALRMLKEQAQRTPPGQWIRVVGGWTEFQFAERRMPTLEEVNAVAPETPVFILHLYCRALLNKAALRACGYTKDTLNPPGGEIQHDSKGNPTGLLIARPNAAILYAT